ncbi:DUF4143 domain-containing protein, partial [Candidatus Nomurabacteria bacterium]|nr:DUF4143 domain-containing protein [Candidatus Nomurabacteria bacterium]
LGVFSNFLTAAALTDTEMVNFTNIASDCGVSSNTVKAYFDILCDTYLGSFLPAFRKRMKRKIIETPKFYFFDVGVVNYLAKRKNLEPGNELFGKAFENWIFHELKAYDSYQQKFSNFSYWRLASGTEVDFIVNDMEVAIEAKSRERIDNVHLKGIRELKKDHPELKKTYLVCLDNTPRITQDDILILPVKDFISKLWSGEIF